VRGGIVPVADVYHNGTVHVVDVYQVLKVHAARVFQVEQCIRLVGAS
jgi:hypothetical protein